MIKEKYGIVALLDALGTKNLSIAESINFISNVSKLIKSLETHKRSIKKEFIAFDIKEEPEILTFGDTIIFTWNLEGIKNPERFLPAAAEWIRPSILSGITNGLLLRGALSIGHYIRTENIVLGPAISDAASWYEEADWIGIIATPYCGNHINALEEQFKHNTSGRSILRNSFCQYQVPLKNGKQKDLWVVSWPSQLLLKPNDSIPSFSPFALFYNLIKEYPIPKGIESKFKHTEDFFKYYLNDFNNNSCNSNE